MENKVISLVHSGEELFLSWGRMVALLKKSPSCNKKSEMFQWLYTLAPSQFLRLTPQGKNLLNNLVIPKEDTTFGVYSWRSQGRIRFALAAMLCILQENGRLDQASSQITFDKLIDIDLLNQTIINIGAFATIDSTMISQPANITFNNFDVFYENPFDEAIAKNIPQEEWHQWGIKPPMEYLSTSHQAPLLLMALSQYNPTLAVHLVRTALCIDANCGRGSNNRDNAALSIPFLKISDESRQQLVEEAFLLTNMDQFKNYLENGNDSDHYKWLLRISFTQNKSVYPKSKGSNY